LDVEKEIREPGDLALSLYLDLEALRKNNFQRW